MKTRIDRDEIQEFIDLLIAFRDGANLEIGGLRLGNEDHPSMGEWEPVNSVYLDLRSNDCVKYFYRVAKEVPNIAGHQSEVSPQRFVE